MNVISLQNIEKSYGTRLLFKEVNITFTTEKRTGSRGHQRHREIYVLKNIGRPNGGRQGHH